MANGSALQTEQRLAPRLALRCGRKGDPRQYVNQRAWLCANETLFVDAEIGIPGRFRTSGNIILLFTFVSPTIWERKSHSSPTGCVGTGGWAGVGRGPGVQTPSQENLTRRVRVEEGGGRDLGQSLLSLGCPIKDMA